MQNDISTEERIDNYLLNRVSEQERQQFESELASNPELQKELESQRQVANAVQRAAMNSFLKQHAEQRNKKVISLFSSTKRVLWTITSIAAVFVLVIGFMNYNKTANTFRNEGLLAYNNLEIPVARDGNQIDILSAKVYHMIGDGDYSLARKTIEEARVYIKAELMEEPRTDEEKYRNQVLQMKEYDLEWLEVIMMMKQGKVMNSKRILHRIITSNSPYSKSARTLLDGNK
jgi:hypothetical protein